MAEISIQCLIAKCLSRVNKTLKIALGAIHIESSNSLQQNDAKWQTHPPSILNIKMPNLPKIDAYYFKYKISVGNIMKLFYLSHKCISKQVHELKGK